MEKLNRQALLYRMAAVVLLVCVCTTADAAPVPGFDGIVNLTAKEQPIDSFLQEMFGQIDVPVIVDKRVTGYVNGSFAKIPASRLFRNLAKTFGLVMYYDGAVVNIYTSSDLSRRILAVPEKISNRIIRNANDLRLTDNKNKLGRTADGGVIVTGTKRFIDQVEELVEAAKSGARDYEPVTAYRVFYLKYAWSQDVTITFGGHQMVVPGVATILRALAEDGPRNTLPVVSQDQLIRPTRPGLRGQGLGGIGANGRLGMNPQDMRLAAADQSVYQNQQDSQLRGNHVTYNSSKPNNTRIESDPRLNAIIVRTAPEKMSHYEQLITALDVEPQMLEIEATIIDINTDRLRELGINWRWQNGNDEVLFGNGTRDDLLLRPNEIVTPSGRGGFISFVLGNNANFIGRINALEAQGAARVVSRPHVLTLSNVEAIFDNSSTFYVRVAGREEVDLFDISVGTKMRVTPHVFKDNGEVRIKLLITIEDGQQKNQQVDNIPVIENSAINTQALINAGESILIGGLVRETTSESVDKVPLLGDIPGLGNLFKTTRKGSQRVERMFLISPRLANNKHTTSYPQRKLQDDPLTKIQLTQTDENKPEENIKSPPVKQKKAIFDTEPDHNSDEFTFQDLEDQLGLSCLTCE